MKLRDPERRTYVTFPGAPAVGHVSPLDIEAYLHARAYTPLYSLERGWPSDVPFAWLAPRIIFMPPGVTGNLLPEPARRIVIPSPRQRGRTLARVIEAIARNDNRSPGEVLRAMQRRDPPQAAGDTGAMSIRLAARLGVLASLLRELAHRAGDVREELRRLRLSAASEHERLILQRAEDMLADPIDGLNRTAAYIDNRGAPRA